MKETITIVCKTSTSAEEMVCNAALEECRNNQQARNFISLFMQKEMKFQNDLCDYSSKQEGDEVIETITIDVQRAIMLIRIIGNICKTIAPIWSIIKTLFSNSGSMLEELVGKTVVTVNGSEYNRPIKVRRHVIEKIDNGVEIKCEIEAKAASEKEAMELVDSRFEKLGYHKD